jgi:ADP-ribose pyrophosphatase
VAPADEATFEAQGEELIFQGYLLRMNRARFRDPDGQAFEREVIRHPGAVAVVAVDGDGKAALVRQFRAPFGRTVLEIPAGTCDVPGEAAVSTARRELAEEAGLEAASWRLLTAVLNAPGYCDQVTQLFLATRLRPCPTDRGSVEERWMTVEHVALDDLDTLVADGALTDATSIVGLLLAREHLRSEVPVGEPAPGR